MTSPPTVLYGPSVRPSQHGFTSDSPKPLFWFRSKPKPKPKSFDETETETKTETRTQNSTKPLIFFRKTENLGYM